MFDFAMDWADRLGDTDFYLAALADWYVIGLHAALRKSKWAQPEAAK